MAVTDAPAVLPRLLVVDDEEGIRGFMVRFFTSAEQNRFRVQVAASAEDAMKIMESGDEFDIVLSDHRMGKMNGTDFLRWVSDRFPLTGKILMTGFNDQEIAIDAINKGRVDAFVKKPWDNDDLKGNVAKVLEKYRRRREEDNARANLENLRDLARQLTAFKTNIDARLVEPLGNIASLLDGLGKDPETDLSAQSRESLETAIISARRCQEALAQVTSDSILQASLDGVIKRAQALLRPPGRIPPRFDHDRGV